MSPAADLNFMFDSAAECMPRADLAALQLSRLKSQLELAYAKVPHVRAKFDAAGVTPDALKSLDDIRRFPFTTKTDMRDTYPFGLFAVPREQVVRLHASSGTTGKATVVGYTERDIDLWADLMARCMACAGARPGDIVHNAYGYGLFTGGLGVHYGAERLGCTVIPVSGGMTERQVTLMQDFGARVLCATPSYALNIAEVAEGMGVDLRKLPVSVGIFGAEPAGEQAVAVGVVHDVSRPRAGAGDAARHQVGPEVDVGLGVADHGSLAGRAGGGMQPRHLLARHREQAERIGVAHVGLGRERKTPDVVERFQLVRSDPCRIEFGAHMRDLGVGKLKLRFQAQKLKRGQIRPRHAFGGAVEHEVQVGGRGHARSILSKVMAIVAAALAT